MEEICSRLRSLLSEVVARCASKSISLSGGLDSSILAFCLNDKTVRAYAMVTRDFPSTDLVNAQLVAKLCDLRLQVVNTPIDELLEAVEQTIRILQVFNPIEIRNNVVIYLTMKHAKNDGIKSIMTGDGADELFAGYGFFQRMALQELQHDLQRIWQVMHFPSRSISKSLGMRLDTPFLDEQVVEYAKSIPAELKVHQENGQKYGKWILRKAFEKLLPQSVAWGAKAAMQDGSGTQGLTGFFDGIVSDDMFSEKATRYLKKEQVRLQTKEALYYYEIYRRYQEYPASLELSDNRCPNCCYSVKEDSHFCRMCGSFPI